MAGRQSVLDAETDPQKFGRVWVLIAFFRLNAWASDSDLRQLQGLGLVRMRGLEPPGESVLGSPGIQGQLQKFAFVGSERAVGGARQESRSVLRQVILFLEQAPVVGQVCRSGQRRLRIIEQRQMSEESIGYGM
jgi:hypothetical protein